MTYQLLIEAPTLSLFGPNTTHSKNCGTSLERVEICYALVVEIFSCANTGTIVRQPSQFHANQTHPMKRKIDVVGWQAMYEYKSKVLPTI